MTAFRFRVKFDPDPTSLWRDIVIGANRTMAELQGEINRAVGLDQGHPWFIGTDESYWNSDVKYWSPGASEGGSRSIQLPINERTENAETTTIGEMTRQVGLEQYDRICYLYDGDDEWRFYAILKEVLRDASSEMEPEVVKSKGDPIEDQSDSPDEDEPGSPLPEPLQSVLPETAVPVADLRALEDDERVVHVIPILSLRTGYGAVCERFLLQCTDAGYILENFHPGWQLVEKISGDGKTDEELLGELADAVREWHAEIAEISGAMTGQYFDEETVEAMHVELEAELERKGYGHL